MNPPPTNGTSTGSPAGNDMHQSSSTVSWEVLCDDVHPNIDLMRQLEQSMQFHDLDEDDDWSEPDHANDEVGRQRITLKNSMNHNSSAKTQIPDIDSPVQTMWKVRCDCLIGINIILAVITMVFSVVNFTTPDNDKRSLTPVILNTMQLLIAVLFYLVFRIYNHHIHQTNVVVLQKSTKALQFVAQMFPENLHEQLFNHNSSNRMQHEFFTTGSTNHKSQSVLTSIVDKDMDHNGDLPTDIESARIPKPSAIRGSVNSDTTTTINATDASSSKFINNGASCASGLALRNDDYTPIAELYPETTVMLADLAGFTAWSAVHEPSDVFMLLETIFYEFDLLATKRNIFKVETVGDCYVAVAGVPEPRTDHAIVMARFARECMMRFQIIVQQLEVRFGPGTSELGMRIGLNSGPITGGVLRGERSRFQLFGDTINTAARMESNSCKGRIQVSEKTAQLLFNANKHHWLIKRDDEIVAKGKGALQTYWLDINANNGSMLGSAIGGSENISKPVIADESPLEA